MQISIASDCDFRATIALFQKRQGHINLRQISGTPAGCHRDRPPSSGFSEILCVFFLCAFSALYFSAEFSCDFSTRKKSAEINFLGPETTRWGGVFHAKVAEKFEPSLESSSFLSFEERNVGCPGNFAGMSRTPGGVQKVCAKNVCAHFWFPTSVGLGLSSRAPVMVCKGCEGQKVLQSPKPRKIQSSEKVTKK